MTRVEGWEKSLNDCIEAALVRPFCWGENDCCLFAADAIRALTGRDPAGDYRRRYASAAQAAKLLQRLGGIEAIPGTAGFEEVAVAFARRGDVVLAENDGNLLLGVVDMTGRRIAVPGAQGLVFLPLESALKAWRV